MVLKLKLKELKRKAKRQCRILYRVVRADIEIPGIDQKKILDTLNNLKSGKNLQKHMMSGSDMTLISKVLRWIDNKKKRLSVARTTARKKKQGDFFTDE